MEELEQRFEKLEPDFAAMKGGRIIDVGFVPKIHEGGLAIDYERDGSTYRLVLGYNELGTWKIIHMDHATIDLQYQLKRRIREFLDNCQDTDNVNLKQDAKKLMFIIVDSEGNELPLSVPELKLVPVGITSWITGKDKCPDLFLFYIQADNWLYC